VKKDCLNGTLKVQCTVDIKNKLYVFEVLSESGFYGNNMEGVKDEIIFS